MKLKKMLSLTLALALSLALTVPSMAAGTTETVVDEEHGVTITMNGFLRKETHTYTVNDAPVALTLYVLADDYKVDVKASEGFRYVQSDEEEEAWWDRGLENGFASYGYAWKSNTGYELDGDVLFGLGDIYTPLWEAYTATADNSFETINTDYSIAWIKESDFAKLTPIDGQPTTPVQPEQPAEPVAPVEPTQPAEPVAPVEPTQPAEPVAPVEPTQPEQPSTPADPAAVTTVEVSTGTGQRLNVRTGPGTGYKIAGPSLANGTVLQIVETQGQWGKLANDAGWVYLPGTKTVSAPVEPAAPAEPAAPTTVEVSTGSSLNLNVRTGPGTGYKIAAPSLKNGTVLQIVETQGQWGKLADDAGWVYLPGTKAVNG